MAKGIFYSVLASILFGCVYYLSVLLQPISGAALFGWRTLVTLPFVFLAVFLLGQQGMLRDFLIQLKKQPHLWFILLFTSANMGVQMWLFLWAPVNGKAIEVSIGYLLLPLVMVMIGRCFFKERLSRIKAFAVFFAAMGVFSKIILTGVFSWETLLVCLGYPIYFSVRRYFKILHLSSFAIEMLLLLPISLYFAAQVDMAEVEAINPMIYWGVLLLGIIGGIALSAYILSSQILPINLLGLMGYLEPMAMLVVSFLIGEILESNSYLLMVCLFISVSLLVFEGMMTIKLKK
ncbi:MAG: EamA family transporter RarD [Lonepinella koalarum]|nr:EamA family transporter RarD [Lonepinella koalarum]